MSAATLLETAAVARAGDQSSSIQEWLTFRLGEEEYGIDILSVQEIRTCEKPTRIANMPDFIKGVVDLRGIIVPILDLRMTLGMPSSRYDATTVTIVLNIHGRTVGAVVDAVSDVLELGADHVKPLPALSSSLNAEFITGIGSLTHDGRERMLLLLDLAALFRDLQGGRGDGSAVSV